jgi:hypothetical protein
MGIGGDMEPIMLPIGKDEADSLSGIRKRFRFAFGHHFRERPHSTVKPPPC